MPGLVRSTTHSYKLPDLAVSQHLTWVYPNPVVEGVLVQVLEPSQRGQSGLMARTTQERPGLWRDGTKTKDDTHAFDFHVACYGPLKKVTIMRQEIEFL